MLKVGLTGGMGSGKTTVARIFEVLGIPIYYADDRAKSIMNDDEALKEKIINQFGPAVYTDGLLNRKSLAEIVFNAPEKLQALNALVHPATIRDAALWIKKHAENRATSLPYVLKEAALIFESGSQENLDYVIGVSAPLALRIQRSMHRDAVTREEVLARMDRQLDEIIKMKLCDFVINNDEQALLIPQVLQLHENLSTLSKK